MSLCLGVVVAEAARALVNFMVPVVVEHVAPATSIPPDGADFEVTEYRLAVPVPSHTTMSLPSPLDVIVKSDETPTPNQPHPSQVTSNSTFPPSILWTNDILASNSVVVAGELQHLLAVHVDEATPSHSTLLPLFSEASVHAAKASQVAFAAALQQAAASFAFVHVVLTQLVVVDAEIRPLLPLSAHRLAWSVMVEHLAGAVQHVATSHVLSVPAHDVLAPLLSEASEHEE
jgi:hypothetical protein